MQIEVGLTDEAILGELGARLARWRLERNLSQAQFGELAGVGRRTIQRLESGEPVQLASLIRSLRVLGLLDSLDLLVPEPTPSPVQRLKLAGRERKRARPRGHSRNEAETAPWRWGTESADQESEPQ